MTLNLDHYSFDEWIEFVFDHEVNHDDIPWHFDIEFEHECKGELVVQYLTKLFNDPEFLMDRFSIEKIEQGFWFIPSSNGFMWAILDDSVSLEDRKVCIFSIKNLFSKLFEKYDIGTSGYMWWDSIFSYCVFNEKDLCTEVEVLKILIDLIKELSSSQAESTQKSALHGIDHLKKIALQEEGEELSNIINNSL